jgi:uncharacterized RDD family membrane protein YckC
MEIMPDGIVPSAGGEGAVQARVGAASGPGYGQGFEARAGAFLADGIVLSLEKPALGQATVFVLGYPSSVGIAVQAAGFQEDLLHAGLIALRGLGLIGLDFLLFEWLYGATPGKLILRLRVVQVDGRPCTLQSAAVRDVLRLVDGLCLGIPAAASMEPPLEQRIGDRAARAIVVDARQYGLQSSRSRVWLPLAAGLYPAISFISQLVGHLTYMSPFLKGGMSRSLHRAAGVGAGATQGVTPLATTSATCGALSTPFERGWIPIPAFGDSLKPSDDLFRLGRMLSVEGTSFENALYGLSHI